MQGPHASGLHGNMLQVDIKNRRHLLKKIRYEELRPEALFIGSVVTVYARQLKLISYGDEFTRAKFEAQSERCVRMGTFDAWVQRRWGPLVAQLWGQ